MKRIYLVDVSSLFFRAFYAVRPLSSPKGLPVNAIYGFMSMLLKLMKDEKPDSVVFCHDLKTPSFRKGLYSEYKANRTEMPEDMVPQFPYIKTIAYALGIPSIEKTGFEADDVIGTLVQTARAHDFEVFIVSGDKDFAQVLRPHVWILDTMKNQKIGPKEAKEKWGVEPSQMIDYLAIVGDSSDNIPGVKGLGPKGAQKLLEEFGSLEKIYENLDQIKGAAHEKLKANREMAFLSKKLVTIVTDVPLSSEMSDYHLVQVRQKEIQDLISELNFRGFERAISELPNWGKIPNFDAVVSSQTFPVVEKPVAIVPVSPRVEVSEAVQVAEAVNEVSISELAKKIKPGQKLWGWMHSESLYIGDDSDQALLRVQDEPGKITEFFNEIRPQWKGFDLKSFWHSWNFEKPQGSWDAMLASYVLRAGDSPTWDRVYSRALGAAPSELPTPQEKWAELQRLEKALEKELVGCRSLLTDIEMPLLPILYRMEKRGIRVDTDLLKIQSAELTEEIGILEKKIHEAGQGEFNVASPKQLAIVLFEKLALPTGKKTKTGFSTDNEVLEKLKSQHPIADLVLQYRELAKLKSTYVDALPLMVKADGRVHTTFNQAHTATGRLSSTDPNLQNIPIRTPRGERVRRAFVATPGQVLMSVDYSQIELRILAHYSNDANLIRAFEQDLDVHAATAAEIFSISLNEVTSEHRRTAKAVNFGIAYGQGAFGLAEVLGIPRGEAQGIIQRYFERFPGVKSYIENMIKLATEKGYVETLDGRRRYMDELKSGNAMMRKFGERAAINAPIQGSAADLVKKAMIQADRETKSDLILQVHDELIFEGPEEQLREEASRIVALMQKISSLRVPLKANWAIGANWDEAHA